MEPGWHRWGMADVQTPLMALRYNKPPSHTSDDPLIRAGQYNFLSPAAATMPDKKVHSGAHIGLTDGLAAHATGIDPSVLQAGYALLEEEKGMSLRQCLSTHWRAALWSAFLSTALWMEGFDTSIVSQRRCGLSLSIVSSARR